MLKKIAITVIALSAFTANHFKDEIVCRTSDVHFKSGPECVGFTDGEYTALKSQIVAEYEREKDDGDYDFDINNRDIVLGVFDYELEKTPLDFEEGMNRNLIRSKLINLLKDGNN